MGFLVLFLVFLGWVGLGFFFFCFLLLSNYLWICISLNLLVRCGSAGKKPKSTYSASVFLKLIKLVSLPPSLLLPHFFKLLNCSYLNPHDLFPILLPTVERGEALRVSEQLHGI